MLRSFTFAATIAMAPTTVLADDVLIALSGTEDIEKNGEYVFISAFSDHLAENGMDVVVHPSNTLGAEDERFDQTSQGLIQVNMASPAMVYSLAPITKGLYLPFLFDSNEGFDAAIENGLMDEINAELSPHGIRLMGFSMRGGQAGLFNSSTPVDELSDTEALRLRGKDGEQVKMFEAWGSAGTIVSWGEIANALQTGVADGYFNPPASALLFGHTDILKHYTPLDAGPSARMILASQDWYEGLSDEERQVIDAAAERGVAANRDWAETWSASALDQLVEQGVTVTELADGEKEKFVEASMEVWPLVSSDAEIERLLQARGS
ncbi:MAG: TRAP transporter substrate-binding protein [Pseudomonadota bacterium]